MKKLFIILLFMCAHGYAQMSCTNLISAAEFNQHYNAAIKLQGDKAKYNFCLNVLNGRCFLSSQVKALAMLFNTDALRLQFAMEALGHTYDLPNFYEVYDAFKTFSAAFKLNDYMNGMAHMYPPVSVPVPAPDPVPAPVPVPPCKVSNSDYEQCKNAVEKEAFDNTKMTIAKQILAAKKCFSSSQIKGLVSIFSFDNSKLELAKYAYDYCMDKENYYTLADAFSFSSSKDDLMNYIKNH